MALIGHFTLSPIHIFIYFLSPTSFFTQIYPFLLPPEVLSTAPAVNRELASSLIVHC